VDTIFDDCPGKLIFLHQIKGIPNQGVWEIACYEVNYIVTWDMALALAEYVTKGTKEFTEF
jgi:hypothetical protein